MVIGRILQYKEWCFLVHKPLKGRLSACRSGTSRQILYGPFLDDAGAMMQILDRWLPRSKKRWILDRLINRSCHSNWQLELNIITRDGLSETAKCIPEMWDYHVQITNLSTGNTIIGRLVPRPNHPSLRILIALHRDQCMAINRQLKEGIDASYQCLVQDACSSEIKELHR